MSVFERVAYHHGVRQPLVSRAEWWPYGVFTPEQDNHKTNVEAVHSYDAFHARSDMSGVKGIIGMHRFHICLAVVLSLSCSGVKTPLHTVDMSGRLQGENMQFSYLFSLVMTIMEKKEKTENKHTSYLGYSGPIPSRGLFQI